MEEGPPRTPGQEALYVSLEHCWRRGLLHAPVYARDIAHMHPRSCCCTLWTHVLCDVRWLSRAELLSAKTTPCPAGDVSRKHIKDPVLLRFIDLECFIWSTVSAELTPMMNAGMVSGVFR